MLFVACVDHEGTQHVVYGADDERAPEAQKQRFPTGAHEDKCDYDGNPDQRTAHDGNDGRQPADRTPEHGRANSEKPETEAEKQALGECDRQHAVHVRHHES